MTIITLEAGVDVAEEMNEPIDSNEIFQPEDWRDVIKVFINDGEVPTDRWAARCLKAQSAHYTMLDVNLYRQSAFGP